MKKKNGKEFDLITEIFYIFSFKTIVKVIFDKIIFTLILRL